MTVGISFLGKGCPTSHCRSEINKMKLVEYEYKSLDDVVKVTGFTKPMSVYFLSTLQLLHTVCLSDTAN